MAEGRIEARGLGKRFSRRAASRPRTLKQMLIEGLPQRSSDDRFWAVRDASFTVARGQMLGVLGQNGSGKSTLLRMLGGVMRPDEGEVTHRGRLRGLLDLNSGMHPDLSGRENVFINGVIAGLTYRQIRERFDEIVAFAELEESIDAPVRTYSAGMKLRLGFAVSTHTDPEILLIDEVLSVGDLSFQQKCLKRVETFKEAGCAIVLITHDLTQLVELCDQALWLQHGECIARGEPQVLVGEYQAQMMSESRRRAPADAAVMLTADGVELRQNENRFGSREAEILDVRLRDARGGDLSELRPGQGMSVEFTLRAPSPLDNPHLVVSFGREMEDDCVDVSTESDGVSVERLQGEQRITLKFSRLDLAAGEYWVSVGVYETAWRYAYDYHWRGYKFSVHNKISAGGGFAPPRQWAIVS